MVKASARLLALLALAHAAAAGAAGQNVTLAATRGETNYESDRNWSAVDTNRFMVGFDFGDVPVYVELAYMESGQSTYDFFAYCGGCVVAGIPPDNREVSAWQLAAGYRLWTHQRTGSALSVRAGVHRAKSSVYVGESVRYRSNGLALGAAGTFMVTPAVGLRAELEWLQAEDIEQYSATQALVGAVVKFGGYPK